MSNRTTARMLGVLFLVVMLTWSIGFWLIEDVLNTSDFLANANPQKSRIFLGIIFELLDVAAIIGIMVTIFPLMKKFSERMALWYFGLRIFECMMLVVAILSALVIITVSQRFVDAASTELTNIQFMGDLLLEIRQNWVHLVLPFFYSAAGLIFFYFFYRVRLIPRFISVVGFVGALLVMAGIPLDFFEFDAGSYIGALMGLTEIFLGIWLIVKGFDESSVVFETVKSQMVK